MSCGECMGMGIWGERKEEGEWRASGLSCGLRVGAPEVRVRGAAVGAARDVHQEPVAHHERLHRQQLPVESVSERVRPRRRVPALVPDLLCAEGALRRLGFSGLAYCD